MQTREQLERRIRELEAELAAVRAGSGPGAARFRSVRYQSALEWGGLPVLAIASGPDPAAGEFRGHARGIVAIGDVATGVLAIGGLARGLVAFGGLAIGGLTFGGLSIGAFAAVGGLAVGSLAFGGGAIGWTAMGGGAAGAYACGGGAIGEHVVDARRQDAEAVAHFADLGLGFACPARRRPQYR
jgi:hypothetical protein